ncbi:phosphotransferase [Microbacterium helvum]|uniref:phosphotransferase n=1 Tax=Microbacterium helvum TaxID=2773713 RepID=UPI002964049B|nr:phosphotransferase [Microbacterium helvum]
MEEPARTRAIEAARGIASALGLACDEVVVLNDSNKLTLRLLPGDVLARVAPDDDTAWFELDLARRIIDAGGPVAETDPRVDARVYEGDGFFVTLWTFYPQLQPPTIAPAAYADALARFHSHAGDLQVATPHFTDRVREAQDLLASRERTPELAEDDRALLARTLDRLAASIAERGGREQLLHGEPHPGNLLSTPDGVRFIDLETCCRGPVEFDVAHAPEEGGRHYSGIDRVLLRECRMLVLAMVITWRWDRDDQLPDGRRLAATWLDELRTELAAA